MAGQGGAASSLLQRPAYPVNSVRRRRNRLATFDRSRISYFTWTWEMTGDAWFVWLCCLYPRANHTRRIGDQAVWLSLLLKLTPPVLSSVNARVAINLFSRISRFGVRNWSMGHECDLTYDWASGNLV
jgi:hypothetical protein